MYTFDRASILRIKRVCDFVESRPAFVAETRRAYEPSQPVLRPWETFLFLDDSGALKLKVNGGWRLIITGGQPEYIAESEHEPLSETGYIYMRYRYGSGWKDSAAQYGANLPDDDGQTRTLLIAVVEYDESKGYRVRQCRNICEVRDFSSIDSFDSWEYSSASSASSVSSPSSGGSSPSSQTDNSSASSGGSGGESDGESYGYDPESDGLSDGLSDGSQSQSD